MSALALPITVAPARPGPPQGAAGDADATGFKGLLETCIDQEGQSADVASSDATLLKDPADSVTPMTAVPVAPAAIVVPQADAVTPAAVVPAAPVANIVPVAVALPAEPAPEAESAAAAEGAAATATADIERPAPKANGGAQPATWILPAVAAGVARDAARTATPDAVEPDAVEPDAAAAKTAIGGTPAAGAVPASPDRVSPPAPPPPPLRALAERAARPLDTTADKTADASSSGQGTTDARAGAATASAAPDAAMAPVRVVAPRDAVPRLPADAALASDAPSIDAAPATAGETTNSPTLGRTLETSLSGLSRTTIEATAQIAAQILRKLEGRTTRFEMALTPDDLGRVDVKLDIDSEGRLAARLAFDNPAAATDLRGRADQLRRELEDAGFHLADDAFEFTERDSGSSSFDRGQDARQGQNRAFAAASRLNAEIDVAQPPRWMALSLSPAGVDLKV